MSKELESLKELGDYRIDVDNAIGYCIKDTYEYSVIETALKDYEELFKMFPYEETTARQLLIVLTQLGIKDSDTLLKKLKALEFIKDILEIEMFVGANKRVDYVLYFKNGKHAVNLNEETYDLFKEVLL